MCANKQQALSFPEECDVSLRDLKHREMKEPNEPKFQLQEFVNKEMKGVGCCRS